MDEGLTDEQRELGALLRDALDAGSAGVPADVATDFDRDLWATLCDQVGVAGLAIPEEDGGLGFGFVESAVVLEELGYSLRSLPYLVSAVLAPQALLSIGEKIGPVSELLSDLAGGTKIAAVVGYPGIVAESSDDSVTAQDGTVSGHVGLVLDAPLAGILLVVVPASSGADVHLVNRDDAGVTVTPRVAVDSLLSVGSVHLDAAPSTLLGTLGDDALEHLRLVGVAATCALLVGVAQRALDLTVAYSKDRVQFGRAIGSFQALKHRMADMHVLVESSRSVALAAAHRIVANSSDAAHWTATAKAWCGEAASQITGEAIQLHGGIGITWEARPHLAFKRAHSLGQLWGDPAAQRTRLGIELTGSRRRSETN